MKDGLFTFHDGTKHWYKDDNLHREDGPAVIYPNGARFWYINDQLHREDGPAAVHPNGNMSWFLHGVEYTKTEFNIKQNLKFIL